MEIISFIASVALYFFFCYCAKSICENAGIEPGFMIWIPLVQLIPLVHAAGLDPWFTLAYLVPIVNVIFLFYHWARICIALDKSPWLVVMMIVPIVNLAFIPYLAFTSSPRTHAT